MVSVTALVPTFRRPAVLVECLDSLLGQTRPIQEIIVIDDGSGDETPDVVRRYGPTVRYVHQENGGKASALNRGLRLATSDYIWICDDDDIALPRATEALAGALDRGDAGFSFGRYRRFVVGPNGKRQHLEKSYWPGRHPTSLLHALCEDFFIFQFASLVRRAAFDAVGGFREDLLRSQDYEMMLRLARRIPGCFVEEEVFLQREHSGDRGAAKERFSAEARHRQWIEHDQKIFRQVFVEFALEEFTPPEAADAPEEARWRSALLQRACIMARKQLWDLALSDLQEAAQLGDRPLEPYEVLIARRIPLSKFGCAELTKDPQLRRELRALRRQGRCGGEILENIGRGLVRAVRTHLRDGEWTTATAVWFALLLLVGPVCTARQGHAATRRSLDDPTPVRTRTTSPEASSGLLPAAAWAAE